MRSRRSPTAITQALLRLERQRRMHKEQAMREQKLREQRQQVSDVAPGRFLRGHSATFEV